MPFLNYDFRELEPYKKLKCPKGLIVPTTDEFAWRHFKKYRWVYNKLGLALAQGIDAAPVGVEPKKYPVFQKPVYNLWGGGVESYLVKNKKQLQWHPGLFWQTLAIGKHYSVDCIVQDGKPLYFVTFEGFGKGAGYFDLWELCKTPAKEKKILTRFINKHFKGYSGCLNFELIGGTIIEGHLRMGDIDKLFDLELMQSIVDVYAGKKFNFDYQYNSGLYLLPIWAKQGEQFDINDDKLVGLLEDATFYHLDDDKFYELNPPKHYRILMFGSKDLDEGQKIRNKVYRYLKTVKR